jgi:hypothetical protein
MQKKHGTSEEGMLVGISSGATRRNSTDSSTLGNRRTSIRV